MTDQFLAIPDRMVGSVIFPQEAVDWLAFGSPATNARLSLSLDDQIRCIHRAAGILLLSLWGGDLPAYVHSPGANQWFQVPALYWGKPSADEMRLAVERPQIPDRLPAQPRPLDPRYGIAVQIYPHDLPSSDVVGQPVAFRTADVERHCSITGPVHIRQKRQSLSVMPLNIPASVSQAFLEDKAEERASERWSESRMTEAIIEWVASMSSRDRERAWANHFKALASEHGWKNDSFRRHWSTALSSKGRRGRPKSAA